MNLVQEATSKVLVVNEKNEALILTVGDYKARPDKAFKPDLPGGMVDPGETELDAVYRELQEEAGIVLNQTDFRLVYTETEYYPAASKSVLKFFYLVKLNHTPPVMISWEHASYAWVPLETLRTPAVELRSFYRKAVDFCFTAGLL